MICDDLKEPLAWGRVNMLSLQPTPNTLHEFKTRSNSLLICGISKVRQRAEGGSKRVSSAQIRDPSIGGL